MFPEAVSFFSRTAEVERASQTSPKPGDQVGYALSSWNFGVSTHRDLAIGVLDSVQVGDRFGNALY